MILPEKYINPFTDFGFKRLFGTEPNKDLLIHFLNQFLPDKHQIKDLTYSKNEHAGESVLDRKAIFDLYCTGANGERFIVEIQKAKQDFFKDRGVYYASFPIQEQGQRGDWDYQLNYVYLFGILDFQFTDHKDDPHYIHEVQLKSQTCAVFYDKLKFVYIEMPKFTKGINALETLQDKWLYVFKNMSKLQDYPAVLQENIFKKLFQQAEIAKYSEDDREAYKESWKSYLDLHNVTESAKREGEAIGMEKGEAIGIEKGIQKEKEERIVAQIKRGKLTDAEISEDFSVPISYVIGLRKKHTV